MGEQQPVRLEWERETSAPIDATWALFSDTDRYNRAAGFDFSFEESPRPDGTVRRTGRARALGVLPLTWEERPFRYQVPQWFESVRLFEGGPAERLVVRLELEERGAGRTKIRYTIAVTPRSALTRPLVSLELSMFTRPRVERVIGQMLRRLAGEDAQYDPLPEPLTVAAEERLLAGVPRIPPPIGDRLAAFIREAPLPQQVQIHPLQLARAWDLPEDRVLDGVLAAVREGMLALRWDLLCPECRGAKKSVERLSELPTSAHCPSCNIEYDGTFPDSLVVSVAPLAAIRPLSLEVACIGSPGRQTHVLAQEEVPVSATRKVVVELAPGTYRIRARPGRGAASLIVYDTAPVEPITLRIAGGKIQPDRVVAPPGKVSITLENYGNHPAEVALERRALPEGVLTVGRLLERPRAREMLPEASLMPGMDLLTRQGAVLAAESRDPEVLARAAEQVRRQSPRVLTVSPQGILAVWEDFSTVLRVAAQLAREPALHLAVSQGPVTEATLGSRTLPMGSTVEAALSALAAASKGHAAIPADRADVPEVRDALGVHTELLRVDFPLSTGVRVHWIHFHPAAGT